MFHGYPYTDFHELNLDDFFNKFKSLSNDFSKLQNTFNEYIAGLDFPNELLERLNKNRILNTAENDNEIYFYVDCNDGDDNNTGRTREDPMRTLEAVIQKASILYNDLRIWLIGSGTYEADFLTLSNGALHLIADAPNVTVYSTHDFRFYNSHLNVQGRQNGFNFVCQGGGNTFYLDGGDITVSNATFNCIFRLNGAWGSASGCTFRNIYVNAAWMTFHQNCVITDKYITNEPALNCVNSQVYNSGPLTINLTANQSGDFATIYGGQFTITPPLNITNDHTYAGDLKADHGTILLADNVRASLAQLVNDIDIGPIEITPDLISTRLMDNTTTVSSDGWVTLQEITNVPKGRYIVLVMLRCTGTHEPANLRLVTDTDTYYNSVNFDSNGVWTQLIGVQRKNTSGTMTLSIQNANGTTVRANTKIIGV